MIDPDPAAGIPGPTGPPASFEELMARIGRPQLAIYTMVRQTLDDLEQATPWDDLYYPPADVDEFLRKATLLLTIIEGIPQRVSQLIAEIESGGIDASTDDFLGDLSFFFTGIHMSVEQEIHTLQRLLERFREVLPGKEPSSEDRDYTFELCADLKGKYTSSIMGAAASLIAGGQWRGVEIEPILFPEKAEEFERNERLVETLSEVTERIHNILDQVPLADFVERWKRQERVDQYALTALYHLLGGLGTLMQETSRRALYSGDYHQIQRREGLLASRVNELTNLHNMSWGTVPMAPGQSKEQIFERMVRAATELAAVLHIEILKKIIGDSGVDVLHQVVVVEKDADSTVDRWRHGQEIQPHTDRAKVPEKLHSLIVLLYDEDLHTFLELLLGSVLKRASLTVRKEMEAQAPPEVMESLLDSIQVVQPEEVATQIQGRAPQEPGSPGPASHGFADPGMAQGPGLGPADGPARIDFHALPDGEEPTQQIGVGREAWDSSTLDAELDSLSSPGFDEIPAVQAYKVDDGPPATDLAGRQQMMGALEELEGMIDRLTSPSTPSLRSFQLIQRLLKQNRSIPPAMLQSMQPYLFDMMNELLPRLEHGPLAPRFGKLGGELVRDCQLLCRPQLGPELLRGPVPEAMQRITNLLQELRTRVAEAMEELSGY